MINVHDYIGHWSSSSSSLSLNTTHTWRLIKKNSNDIIRLNKKKKFIIINQSIQICRILHIIFEFFFLPIYNNHHHHHFYFEKNLLIIIIIIINNFWIRALWFLHFSSSTSSSLLLPLPFEIRWSLHSRFVIWRNNNNNKKSNQKNSCLNLNEMEKKIRINYNQWNICYNGMYYLCVYLWWSANIWLEFVFFSSYH